jgi:hypothetical protein
LALSVLFEAENINQIAKFIYNEANRRGTTSPQNVSTNTSTVLLKTFMNAIKANLAITNHPTAYVANAGQPGLRAFGQDLIDKAKEAYNEVIGLP